MQTIMAATSAAFPFIGTRLAGRVCTANVLPPSPARTLRLPPAPVPPGKVTKRLQARDSALGGHSDIIFSWAMISAVQCGAR